MAMEVRLEKRVKHPHSRAGRIGDGRRGPNALPYGAVLRRLCNWREIDTGVALSGQGMQLPMLALMRDEQVRSLVNLRGANAAKKWYRVEVADCARLGIEHCNVRLSSKLLPEPATLLTLLDAFERLQRPMLIKCASGVDRSTFAAALYRLGSGGAEAARAQGDLKRRRLRHLFGREQRWVRAFPDYFEETKGRRKLRGWIEEVYSVAGFEAYLRERGMSGCWRERHPATQLFEPAE